MNICAVLTFSSLLFSFWTGSYPSTPNVEPLFLNSRSTESKWSGTVSWHKKFSGITGTSDLTVDVSFSDAVPTMYRSDATTDLNFKDDKGKGTVTIHNVSTLPGQEGVTDCTSSGLAELHAVTIRDFDNTYDIEVRGPACKGGTTVSKQSGSEPYNEDGDLGESMTITQPLGSNHNVLTGSTTLTGDLGELGSGTTTVRWTLVKGRQDTELIVSPKDYDKWLPEPGIDETRKGTVMEVDLEVQGVAGKPPQRVDSFDVSLVKTSREPGITLNYPITPSSQQLPDLRLVLAPVAESVDEGQELNVSSPDGKTGKFYIASYDGGGYATLNVSALLDDNKTRIEGHLLVSNGNTDIAIPKRLPGSLIGEAWAKANGNPGDRDDKETSDGNIHDGDGLSAYEEYRGVISEGKFKRLDPQKKELGILVKKDQFQFFAGGIALFESATTIKPILFNESEIGDDRRLNKNSTNPIYKQYVEKLEKEAICYDKNGKRLSQAQVNQIPANQRWAQCGGVAGENQPIAVTAKLPEKSERVVIDVDKLIAAYQDQAAAARRGNVAMPYTESESIDNTVAHELAHGINVNHHGLPSSEADRTIPMKSFDVYHIFANDGVTEITKDFLGQTLSDIGTAHNDESGDMSCIMAYTSLYHWAFKMGTDGSFNYYSVPLLPIGKTMCRSKNGASPNLNANNKYFGDAQTGDDFGNCMSQMKLKP